VHSSRELRSSDFGIRVAGSPGALDDVFPGFTEHDRVGMVVRAPCGGLGASVLLLAAITAFYDAQRERSDDFFVYPDYFVFHVGSPHGDHRRLDVWPPHKEVVVPQDGEALLQAVNDRAVTRLLVPDGTPGGPSLDRATVASAAARVRSCLAYSEGGRAAGGDVSLRGNRVTESYVSDTIARCQALDDGGRDALTAGRRALVQDGAATETYRRIALEEALALLGPDPRRDP
jgi:hypothetical protein